MKSFLNTKVGGERQSNNMYREAWVFMGKDADFIQREFRVSKCEKRALGMCRSECLCAETTVLSITRF